MLTPNSSRVDQVKTDEEIERHLNLPHKNSKLFLIKILVIMKIIKLILTRKIIIVIIIMIIIIITLITTIYASETAYSSLTVMNRGRPCRLNSLLGTLPHLISLYL